MEYILIIHMTFYQKYPMVEHIEFKSQKSCEDARLKLDNKIHRQRGGYYMSLCVEK